METAKTGEKAQGARTYSLTLAEIKEMAENAELIKQFQSVGEQFEFLTAKQVLKEARKRAEEAKPKNEEAANKK